VTVELRLRDPRDIDWAHSAEGWLVVYDPKVVTDRVFEELAALGRIVNDALGWVAGHVNSPGVPLDREHTMPQLGRSEAARRLAHLVRLAWERALMPLDCLVAWNGMDVRFTAGGLTGPERREPQAPGRLRRGLTTLNAPRRGRITARGPRLGVTWGFLLAFTPRQKREFFLPGYQAEFPWPAGDYQASAWAFEPEEDDSDALVDRLVVQLTGVPSGAEAGG
jgi:hypothetical protein